MKTNRKLLLAAGLAALLLAPAPGKGVEVYSKDNVKVDVGARMQLLGEFRNSVQTEYIPSAPAANTAGNTGNGNRDFTEIYLFQKQNRLKLNADLDGVLFRFENAMGAESYAGGNNLYDLIEMNGEIPFKLLGESTSIVAGLIKRPESVRDSYFDENLLFTGESELSNLFFNSGYDTGLYLQNNGSAVKGLLGVVQGVPNLPQRYIPERLMLPVPVIARLSVGNIKDSFARGKQQGFEKPESLEWALDAGGFWVQDSSAGHGTLFGQLAGQAEVTKGPFINGNCLFSKNFNPFMQAGAYTDRSSMGPLDNQFWQANVGGRLRMAAGDNAIVAGANWEVAQFITKGLNNRTKGALNPSGGVIINGKEYNFGQITVQGGEAFVAYVAPSWWAAGRVDVLVPDAMLGPSVQVAGAANANKNFLANSAFQNNTLWEITFPALGYRINKFVTLTAELEHNLNAIEVLDTDGEYQLKTVPIEASLGVNTAANTLIDAFRVQPYQMNGRLMLQVAF